jgi:hypothetical protein
VLGVRAALPASGADADGSRPTILLLPAYAPNPAAGQSLADFFGLLLHGPELSRLTVYLAPYAEMQALCGSVEADSCYDPSEDTMYTTGSLDADVYVYVSRYASKPLAKSRRAGHRDHITGSICGLRRVLVAVVRYKGRGGYRLRVSLPAGAGAR